MKIRNGFVSNSSSSSFICVICGAVESGYDLELQDFEMVECVKGHVYHEECVKEYKLKTFEDKWGAVTEKSCPVCSLQLLTDDDELIYLRDRFKLTKEDILKDLRTRKETKNED